MKKRKISLRLHIFAAFLIVFLISFSVIIVVFNVVLSNYIQSDVREKITQSITSAINLSGTQSNKDNPFWQDSYKSDSDMIIHEIIRPLTSNSEVYAALLTSTYAIEYPSASDSIKERGMVNGIVEQLKSKEFDLDSNTIHIVKIDDSTTYYVSTVKISIKDASSYIPSTEKYLLLYFDASPFLQFAKNVNRILIIIMFITLTLAMCASLAVSGSINKSTKKLTAFASKIGSGIFKREEFNFFDKELDILATDMNAMADKLDQADKEQKTFFQNASHELRTPLMSIQGYAEGIKYKVFDDVDSASDIIISESQRLTGMVENLLTISRMDTAASGRQNIQKQIFDIKDLLESVVEKMRGSALHSQKNISVHFSDQDMHVFANENDMFRAFENILSNGLRYAKTCVDIDVRAANQDLVQVIITDDGTGIAEDLLPCIFDRFSLGEGGKHGIGLALVKAIVLENKGTVSAANRSDGQIGAVFTVTLHAVSPDSVFTAN